MSTPEEADLLLRFLTEGYVVVQPRDVDPGLHEQLWTRADELYGRVRDATFPLPHLEVLGDNLAAQIPELEQILGDGAVSGAIETLLGPDAYLHPHNFVHESTPADQPFHQDGNLPWNERGHYRSHRPDWVILFYYPQAVTLDNGPTEIVPFSQYWTTDIEKPDGGWRRGDPVDHTLSRDVLQGEDLEARDAALAASLGKLGVPDLERRFVQVPAGSVVIGNYDLIHRGSRTLPASAARYMFKFYYARTRAPQAASCTEPALADLRADLHSVVQSIHAWSRGQRRRVDLTSEHIERLARDLASNCESSRVAAAYELGAARDADSLARLLEGLNSPAEATRRAAAYGLRERADEAAAPLQRALVEGSPSVRRFAAFALGSSWSGGADALIERLSAEDDDLARSNVAYALGQIGRDAAAPVEPMATALIARLEAGAEPDNTNVAGLPRSTVRQSVAYALLQLATNHALPDSALARLAELGGTDPDRYVASMLTEAVARRSTEGALIRSLNARRWHCAPR